MLAKQQLSRNSMDKTSTKSVPLWASILKPWSMKTLNSMSGISGDRKLSGRIGEIIFNKLMASFGLSIVRIK